MSKKLASGIIIIIAIVFLIAGAIAIITLSDLLIPIFSISTPTPVHTFDKFKILVVVVDDIQSPTKIETLLLGFVTTFPKTTLIVEKIPASAAGYVSETRLDITKLTYNTEKIAGIEIEHFLIIDVSGIRIINNLYENLQNTSMLIKDEDLCRILDDSEIEFFTQVLSSLSGHYESDINNEELIRLFTMMKDSSDCYFEFIEK